MFLHRNGLQELSEEMETVFFSMSGLGHSMNPWKCDCRLKVLYDTYPDKFGEPPSCASPRYLGNTDFDELAAEDFKYELDFKYLF